MICAMFGKWCIRTNYKDNFQQL